MKRSPSLLRNSFTFISRHFCFPFLKLGNTTEILDNIFLNKFNSNFNNYFTLKYHISWNSNDPSFSISPLLRQVVSHCYRPENFIIFNPSCLYKSSQTFFRVIDLFSLPLIIPRVITLYGCSEHLWTPFISLYKFCSDSATLDWSIKAHLVSMITKK